MADVVKDGVPPIALAEKTHVVSKQTSIIANDATAPPEVKKESGEIAAVEAKTENLKTEDVETDIKIGKRKTEDAKTGDVDTRDFGIKDLKSEDLKTEGSKIAEARSENLNVKQDSDPTVNKDEGSKPSSKTKTNRTFQNDFRKNRKFDATTLAQSSDPELIRTQVGYYFNDSNLAADKFLWGSIEGPENKPFPLEKLCTFSRMRRFKPYEAVVAALKEDPFFVIEGEAGKETIKRKVPYKLDPNARKAMMARSVYVKGFGDEKPTTQFDLETWFTSFSPINKLTLRRSDDMLFKGSVFTEFKTVEDAKKFLGLDPKPTWDGNQLLIKSKKDYCDEKSKLIVEGKLQPSRNTTTNRFWEGKDLNDSDKRRHGNGKDYKNYSQGGRGRGNGRGRGQRGGRGCGGGRGGNRSYDHRNNARPVDPRDAGMPKIQVLTDKALDKKRSREDGDSIDVPQAKKVDIKPDGAQATTA